MYAHLQYYKNFAASVIKCMIFKKKNKKSEVQNFLQIKPKSNNRSMRKRFLLTRFVTFKLDKR